MRIRVAKRDVEPNPAFAPGIRNADKRAKQRLAAIKAREALIARRVKDAEEIDELRVQLGVFLDGEEDRQSRTRIMPGVTEVAPDGPRHPDPVLLFEAPVGKSEGVRGLFALRSAQRELAEARALPPISAGDGRFRAFSHRAHEWDALVPVMPMDEKHESDRGKENLERNAR